MKQLQNKISDQRGASILMSMLLMLVSIMVCVVGLNAATSALDARKNAIDEQQEYLTVSSAAELFIDTLQDLEFEAYHYEFYGPNLKTVTDPTTKETTITRDSPAYYKFSIAESCNEKGEFYKSGAVLSGTFVNMLQDAVKFIRNSEVANASIEETFTIRTDQTDSLDTVNMTLKMDKRFAVTATFSLATDKSYQIQVKAVPTLTGKAFPTNPSIPVQPEIKYPFVNLEHQDLLVLNGIKTIDDLWGKIKSKHGDGIVPPSEDDFGTTERYMKLQWNSISVTKGGTQ